MRFEYDKILFLLFTLPLMGLFFWWVLQRKRRLLERFAGVKVIERLIETTSRRKQIAKMAGLGLAIAFIIIALARPQWGAHTRPIEKKGVDIMIAIDTSRSMLARDIPPNRLTRAKQELRGLIRRMRGDRVGIVVFAGTAFVQCPLTLDYGLAMDILDGINENTVPVQGTAIGTAVRMATQAFRRASSENTKLDQTKVRGVLVLLTDGEDQGTDPLGAADEAAKEKIQIYAIGIGTPQGNPIPQGGDFKKDPEGNPVNTRLNPETLEKIALKTGGKYIEGKPSGDLELEEVYSSISQLDKKLEESKTYTIYEERFAWFLLIAALLLAWELTQNDRQKADEAK
ncbi:MAG: VWA domain-containing protein [Candidatus Sumerlaeota bacterium]|nr:VWA domain-containing protein [Candidatus Sumerlaeota bacterium]